MKLYILQVKNYSNYKLSINNTLLYPSINNICR